MEIGTLTAVFDADTRKFDAGAKHVEQSAQQTAKAVESSAGRVGQAQKSVAQQYGISADIISRRSNQVEQSQKTVVKGGDALAKQYGITSDIIVRRSKEAVSSGINPLQQRINDLARIAPGGFQRAVADLKGTLGPATAVIPGQAKTISTAVTTIGTAAKTTTQTVKQAAVAVKQDLGGALSTLSPNLAMVAGSAGPLTALAAGLVAVGAAGAGIYRLATFSQQLGGEIFDLSGKVNFTAETLSSLKVAAELSGGSLASLSTSLGIFDRNLEEAHDKSSEMSRIFKALKIDINDNEQALRQSFIALAKLPPGYQQTALAMKLFGRSGKEILGVIKESGGDIDKYIDKLREMGLVITSSGAKKADEFGDKLTMLRNKIEALGRQIGSELVPIVDNAADDISGWLKENQSELVKTTKEAASLISMLLKLVNLIKETSPVTMVVHIVRQVTEMGGTTSGGSVSLAANQRRAAGVDSTQNAPATLPEGLPTLSPFQRRPTSTTFSPFANPNASAITAPPIDYSKPGRGGGGGGAKTQKDALEALKNEVISLNAEFRKLDVALLSSTNLSEIAAKKEDLLADVMSRLSMKTRLAVSELTDVDEALEKAIGSLPQKSQAATRALVDQALAQVRVNQEVQRAGDAVEITSGLFQQWRVDIDRARTGADQYEIAIQDVEIALKKKGLALSEDDRAELRHLATLQRAIDKTKELTRERLAVTRPRRIFEDPLAGAISEATRPRIVTAEEQGLRDTLELIRADMEELGRDVTSIFADSVRDGFQRGTAAGLASLGQGLLDVVQRSLLDRIEEGLGQIFGDLATGGGLLGSFFRLLSPGNSLPSASTAASSTIASNGATRQRAVTPGDVDSQTRSINSATTQQTQALSNQIQLTGQQIVQGLTPVRQGFLEGLLGAAIGGALSGLTSSLTSGLGGDGEDWSNEGPTGPRPTTPPVMRYGGSRASGGPISAGMAYQVHKDEVIIPMQDSMVYNKQQQMGGTVKNYYIQLPPLPQGSSHQTKRSQRQMADQLVAALKGR